MTVDRYIVDREQIIKELTKAADLVRRSAHGTTDEEIAKAVSNGSLALTEPTSVYCRDSTKMKYAERQDSYVSAIKAIVTSAPATEAMLAIEAAIRTTQEYEDSYARDERLWLLT